jgi:alpha-tubulin suppressor-like RCC1 family protein
MLTTQSSNIETRHEQTPNLPATRLGTSPRSALFMLLAVAASTAGCAMNTEGGELTDETQEAQQNPTGGVSTGKPPQFVPDLLVEIGAGGAHTCVRRADGRVWCWGRNDSGQTGGTPVPVYPGYPSGVAQPSRVTGLTAAHLAIGYDHSCALTAAGQALCWGDYFNGALGSSSTIPIGTPAPVGNFNGAPITFSSLGAGEHATCGTQAGTGTVFCWGELTSPGAATFDFPAHLLSPGGFELDNATGVVTGRLGGCIIWGADAGCWTQVTSTGVSNEVVTGWNNVNNGHVSTAKDFTCADLTNGTVGCFGMDNLGQLGDGLHGSTTFNTNTIGQSVGSGMLLHGVSAGARHACALDPSNNLVCWGSNDVGQLGTGTNTNVQPPTQVTAPSGVHFRAVAAGEDHTCAIGTDDHVYCWGSNVYAQIGNGAHNTPNAIFWSVTQAIDPT